MEILFTFFGLIIGAFGTLIYQYYQSKENLKYLLYKEKMNTYKEIMECLSKISAELTKEKDNKLFCDFRILSEQSELLLDISNTNAHLLPRNILAACLGFSINLLNADNVDKVESVMINNYGYKIYSEIRKDLGIQELSDELLALYKNYPQINLKSKINYDRKN